MADETSGLDVLEMEERVFSSPTGLPLSFDELSDFARSTRQVIDGLFVATEPSVPPPRRDETDAAILEQSVAVVSAWDSTFWLVGAPNSWLERLEQVFNDVHDEDIVATPGRAWGPSPG